MSSQTQGRHRVLIVGGGFGGLYAARALGGDERISVTLIDRRNFHLFTPLLYQVATGALSPADIAQPLRSILRNKPNTTVLLGEAVGRFYSEPMNRRLRRRWNDGAARMGSGLEEPAPAE